MTLPLSVSIVCKNAAPTIGRTLDSVQGLASEIVALDSGSTDDTVEILRARGAAVFTQPWLGYLTQSARALERCTQPWLLHLDADESLEPALRESIRTALDRDDEIVGYEVNRKVWYAGAFLEHAWQPEWRLRLVRRERVRWAGFDPHAHLEPIDAGPIARLEGDLRHDSLATGIADFLAKQAFWARAAARAQHERGRRGRYSRLLLSPPAELFKQIVIRSAWRDGWRGWVAASSSAIASVMKHAALIERTFHPPTEDERS